jgi:hypothetical protein
MGCNCGNFSNACGCGSHAGANGNGNGTYTEVQEVKQIGTDILDTVKEGAYDIFDVVKGTGRFVIDETKEGISEIKEQGQKLDERERLIKSIPNSYLVFGAVGLVIYSMIK